jgi:type VI secretion system protein ImpL
MQRWAGQVADGAAGIAAGGARSQLNNEWKSKVLPLCQKALANRYPINRKSGNDVPLTDFAQLFAPNGRIDQFFTNNLLPFVDIGNKPWRWRRTAANADLGISDGVLAQFERAADIRDSFFLGAQPKVNFELKPVELDPNATSVLLEIEGQQLEYAHGPIQPQGMGWPGAGGRVRVAFQPAQSGVDNSVSREGPWAFFRLLDAAHIQRSNLTDRFNVTFTAGGRYATFELRAGSVLNPFSLPALRSFRCPSSL